MKIFKSLYSDIETAIWFLFRPSFYFYFLFLLKNKFLIDKDDIDCKKKSLIWCELECISFEELSIKKKIKQYHVKNNFCSDLEYSKILKLINNSKFDFGGSGHLDLIYSICETYNFTNVIETGVAYGWSSSVILNSIFKRNGYLVSIDMPMIKQKDYNLIGVAVNKKFYDNWSLIQKPDMYGLNLALKKIKYNYDLIHYDSDKSYYGRQFAFPKLYRNLNSNGVFISDDIQDNEFFKEFVYKFNLEYYVIKIDNKFVGVIFKN
jgi:hypothetical protein